MNVIQVRPADEPPIPVAVRFMDGSEETLAVQRSDKLHVMKSQLCAKLGITLARVKLIFGTQELRSDDRAAAAGLEEGSVVNAVVLPPLFQGSQVYEEVAGAVAAGGAMGAALGAGPANRISEAATRESA